SGISGGNAIDRAHEGYASCLLTISGKHRNLKASGWREDGGIEMVIKEEPWRSVVTRGELGRSKPEFPIAEGVKACRQRCEIRETKRGMLGRLIVRQLKASDWAEVVSLYLTRDWNAIPTPIEAN